MESMNILGVVQTAKETLVVDIYDIDEGYITGRAIAVCPVYSSSMPWVDVTIKMSEVDWIELVHPEHQVIVYNYFFDYKDNMIATYVVRPTRYYSKGFVADYRCIYHNGEISEYRKGGWFFDNGIINSIDIPMEDE